uniref:Uncharacterized protein n=1 Tax=uncultured marine group II/III euryarchaeote KM3_115_A12 TaxID=1457854 RepID=A0A075G7R7_9EURY|nr:hypothetical protein [uncultured marine group II/III euryarchaeote KM3_115_A12]
MTLYSGESGTDCSNFANTSEGLKDWARTRRGMVESFLEADDPVLEDVLEWTVARDSADIGRLMQWLPKAQTMRDKHALLTRARELLTEIDSAIVQLAKMQ